MTCEWQEKVLANTHDDMARKALNIIQYKQRFGFLPGTILFVPGWTGVYISILWYRDAPVATAKLKTVEGVWSRRDKEIATTIYKSSLTSQSEY